MNASLVAAHTTCRTCKRSSFIPLFSLGMTPLANAFLSKKQLDEPELYFPLELYLCRHCGLVQLGHVVSPAVLFGNYVYVSSTSSVFVGHFESYAKELVTRLKLHSDSLAVDIGSNDGILLKPFQTLGVRVLGVEPAAKIAEQARKAGIPTVSEFFSSKTALKIVNKYGKASVISANNVFAHIDDLDEVVKGVKTLLDPSGMFVIEAPYLVDFLQKNYFDLVYHEHLSYLSIRSLQALFDRFDMQVVDVQKQTVHGGSIRVFVAHKKSEHTVRPTVARYLQNEQKMKLYDGQTYSLFAKKILENKARLVGLLARLKSRGATIAGYGAPAKGNTLLNYFGIGKEVLDFIVDDSPWKQNLFTPGTHIPVVSSEMLYKKKTDYLLILAWNFAPSIIHMHKRYHEDGGRFIVPVPRPRILHTI